MATPPNSAIKRISSAGGGVFTSIDLSTVSNGRVVEVRTANSIYWVTPVEGSHQVEGCGYRGVMVQTNSGTGQRFAISPFDLVVDRIITVGAEWHYGIGGETTRVVSLRFLGR